MCVWGQKVEKEEGCACGGKKGARVCVLCVECSMVRESVEGERRKGRSVCMHVK